MERTLCLARKSFERGALRSFLRTLEGAEKCRLRHFLRDDDTVLLNFISTSGKREARGEGEVLRKYANKLHVT